CCTAWSEIYTLSLHDALPILDGSGWKMSKIPVIEIFGPTIQGEGMVIGQKTMFVRTAGCDYSCSWCDSAFTWDGSGKSLIKQMTDRKSTRLNSSHVKNSYAVF